MGIKNIASELEMFIKGITKGAKDKEEQQKNVGGSGVAEVSISKHRNGATGVVKLVFLKEYGLFFKSIYCLY